MSSVDLEPFTGETFVAYLDISGFKEYMKKHIAINSLEDLNQIGYEVITDYNKSSNVKISGIFISDCGILFTRFSGGWEIGLLPLLESIKKINIKMLEKDHLTTCSIAYGMFSYQKRDSSTEVRKNPIIGEAYLTAYQDHENGTPKINPGDCRIIIRGAPFTQNRRISDAINEDERVYLRDLESRNNALLADLGLKKEGRSHYYYYWMLHDVNLNTQYKREYTKIIDEKFFRIKEMIKKYAFDETTG